MMRNEVLIQSIAPSQKRVNKMFSDLSENYPKSAIMSILASDPSSFALFTISTTFYPVGDPVQDPEFIEGSLVEGR